MTKPSGASGGDNRNSFLNGVSKDFPLEVPVESPARRGFSISYMGKTLLSRIDPVAQGENLAAEVSIERGTLYFCPSPLYGYGLSFLLENLEENSAILCVEADEKLYEISKKAFLEPALSGGSKKLSLINTHSPESLCVFVNKIYGKRVFQRIVTIHLGGGWQIFPELYKDMEAVLRREINVEWSNAMTLIHLGRLYAKNLIRNLALIPESRNISALDFSSSPVLVLGAGPSLDSTLDELLELFGGSIPKPEERGFKIICVDTSLPALNERGILPDLTVILECQQYNLKAFTGLKNHKISAALDLSALPASARVLAGDMFLFFTPWTELRLLERLAKSSIIPETIPPLGSVGLSGVALALRLGSGPVLTGGIDFSYSMDAYHARCTPGSKEQKMKQNRLRSLINVEAAFRLGAMNVISKNGKDVRSDPAMRNYRELFELKFGGNPRLLDINSSGLSLGIKTVSCSEAFAVLTRVTTHGTVCGTTYGVTSNTLCNNIIDFIRSEIGVLDRLRNILTGAIESEAAQLEELLDKSDYLWAHFPECAGAGGRRPPHTDISFLKRVRTEIDPFLKLWEMSLRDLDNYIPS